MDICVLFVVLQTAVFSVFAGGSGSSEKIQDILDAAGVRCKSLHLWKDGLYELDMSHVYRSPSFSGMSLSAWNAEDKLELLSSKAQGSAEPVVTDLSVLIGLPIGSLNLSYAGVSDLSPLRAMPLEKLNLRGAKISDLKPLAGMPLKILDLSNTLVSDLTPLKSLELTDLDLSHCPVSDLEPLKGMPLTRLVLRGTEVRDFSPLHDMPLAVFVSPAFSDGEVISTNIPAFFEMVQAFKEPDSIRYPGVSSNISIDQEEARDAFLDGHRIGWEGGVSMVDVFFLKNLLCDAESGGASLSQRVSFIDGYGKFWEEWYGGYRRGLEDSRLFLAAVIEAARSRPGVLDEYRILYTEVAKSVHDREYEAFPWPTEPDPRLLSN